MEDYATLMQDAIDRAIAAVGSQKKLADGIGCWQTAVSYMKKTGQASAGYVLKIEALTGVSRHDLRPDLYPREDNAAA